MSTRRLFLPIAQKVSPTWIYGTSGGVGPVVCFPDGSIILPNSDQSWQVIPNIYRAYGPGGSQPATSDPVIMSSSAIEGQAMAMLITPAGNVAPAILGTFLAPNSQGGTLNPIGTVGGVSQYAALLTGAVTANISSAVKLLCAGLFSYYYQSGVANTVGPLAVVDLTAGALDTSFTGKTLGINSTYGSTLAPPKLFSDGNALFGIYSVGLNSVTIFKATFSGVPSGAPVITAITTIGGTAITPFVGAYGGTGINGPFFISGAGLFGSAFAGGFMSWAQPAPAGGGLFVQDGVLTRPIADPARSGSVTQSSTISVSSRSGANFVVIAECSTGGGASFNLIGEGGSTGGSFNSVFTAAAALATAVGLLFPDCSFTFVDGSSFGLLKATITFTQPSGATYFPHVGSAYQWFGSGPALPQTSSAITEYLTLVKSDNSSPLYYQLAKAPLSTAVAVNGSTTCHVYSYLDTDHNVQWVITIPGVIRINVSLAYTLGTSGNGGFASSSSGKDYTDCPVSVVPFGSGFAVALPYDPIYSGTGAAPLGYTFSPAVAAASTTLLFGPIFVLSATGAVDAGFDSALHSHFFALSRTDGQRYGPFNLAVDAAGVLRFGSFYAPGFIDLSAANPTPTDALGNLTPAPSAAAPPGPGFTINPSFTNQKGPAIEVFCAADSSGAKILPT